MAKIRKPKKTNDMYGWQESYADALDSEYVINSLVYQYMNGYAKCDGTGLFKYYNSNHEALQDYFKAAKALLKDVIKGKRKNGHGLTYGSILSDFIYTLENS